MDDNTNSSLDRAINGSSSMPNTDDKPDVQPFILASVKDWIKRVTDAKAHWKPDFDRMKDNMAFVASMQWNGQKTIKSERYVANLTIRAINQKVATLYARDPQVDIKTRQKMRYTVWDGKQETIVNSLTASTIAAQSGIPPAPQDVALTNDYTQGHADEEMVQKVADTLKLVYQYQVDTQEPEFKTQAKQLVRRASVCGVGYIRVSFCRDYDNELSQSETRSAVQDRAKQAQYILDRFQKGDIGEDSGQLETLRSLVDSLNVEHGDSQSVQVKERLVFDFPPANSIIPDPDTRALKGFVGAKWIAEEYLLPLDFVNAFFEVNIQASGETKLYNAAGEEYEKVLTDETSMASKPRVRLFEVFDLSTRTSFIVCDGHNDYIVAPDVISSTSSFWSIFALTFNDIETVQGSLATIFPPSDVDLMMSAQKEWNRTREALRNQRKANAPKYLCPKGAVSEKDKDNIANAADNELIELEQLPAGTEPGKVLQPFQHAAVDPALYDTTALKEDIMFSTGQQEANIGPAQPNVTATVGTIAEQSRMTVTSSNVDDLDDCLSAVARTGGELLIRNMSPQTVMQICGPGAVWPTQNPTDFLNEIQLQIMAGSSGRPNKAVEIANFQQIAPLLLQAGANPQAMIREAIKRLDDRLDPSDFFPLPGQQPMAMTTNVGAMSSPSGQSTAQSPAPNVAAPQLPMPPMQTNSPQH